MTQERRLFDFQQYTIDKFLETKSVLIGDDMGLGKTVQAIMLDAARREKWPGYIDRTLVVAPLSVHKSWEKHFEQWTKLAVYRINTKRRDIFLEEIKNRSYDVYICHWESLRLMPELQKFFWGHIIGDEIHRIQGRKTQQTKALKQLKTHFKTGLSGTPAFDKPDDLWSVLNWLYPTFWSSFWRYFDRHIVWTNYNGYRTVVGVCNQEELQENMRGFYIRRKKEEVLHDLPDKYYSTIYVDLHPQQRRAYNQMRDNMLAWIGNNESQPVNAPVIIAQLIRLQQFAVAYAEIDQDGKVRLTDPSSKIDATIDIILSTDRPVVVFSQFEKVIKLLSERLTKLKIKHGLYAGDATQRTRDKLVEDFQAGKIRVFAGTIAAGGVGITLTKSDTCVFIDRDWSHSMNRQAEDRLHRIGQKNAVHIIDIFAGNTIDVRRHEMLEWKWDIIKKLLGEDDV